MSWGMVAVAGATVVGSVMASKSSKKAAAAGEASAKEGREAQAEASRLAIEEQRRQFDLTQEGLAPFREAGLGALTQQQALLGLSGANEQQAAFNAFKDSPGQQFLRDRAQKNLLRNASALGGLGGGNVRSALVEQGIGFAQQDFQNQFSRLGQIAGQGQAATTNIGQFGAQASGNISNLFGQQGAAAQQASLQAGQARISGIQGQSAAEQQAIGGLANVAGQFFGGQ